MTAALPHDTEAAAQHFEVRPFDAPVGAEIIGLDISKPINAEDFARIHRAHLDHHVLVFRDQRITPAQQVAFSRRFGPLQIHVLRTSSWRATPKCWSSPTSRTTAADRPGRRRPLLAFGPVVQGQAQPRLDAARAGAAGRRRRHAVRQPAQRLGHPARADLKQAGAGPLRRAHLSRQVRGAARRSPWRPKLTQEQIDEVKPGVHPVVRTHPETGRKALFVSEHFTTRIVGLPEDESRALFCQSCSRTACGPSSCTATPGSRTTWCSGTTAR
jgi:taurine dioxygenase